MVIGSRGTGGLGGILSGNIAKRFDAHSGARPCTFANVAGLEEEKTELQELVDFLKSPKKYLAMGARPPRGVLFVGDPGTGKTLLARAVAGESNVPFYFTSGAEFEEVFVGLGASKIREIFKIAKKNSPAIIFIDELDALGRKRGQFSSSASDQTLNQLLVELDGFAADDSVIVIAACNRPDVLDSALTRPGRFDRQILISLPDIKGREAILKLHASNKNISLKVDFLNIAKRTPGFSGAQLENVINEAVLLTVRKNKKVIELEEIDEAIDRVVAGPAKKSRVITTKEKTTTAYHESGHALIGLKLENSPKVQKITIIPRGKAGGYTVMTHEEDIYFYSRNQLLAIITGYLGGRASEEIVFGAENITTGAHDDLSRATKIAREMVTRFGMSSLGLSQYDDVRSADQL
jgi:cell division protease FtsH